MRRLKMGSFFVAIGAPGEKYPLFAGKSIFWKWVRLVIFYIWTGHGLENFRIIRSVDSFPAMRIGISRYDRPKIRAVLVVWGRCALFFHVSLYAPSFPFITWVSNGDGGLFCASKAV